MNKDNFVNIVGYQLERVHDGIIKWLLDWSNESIDNDLKHEIIKRIFSKAGKSIDFQKEDIKNIICETEYSFGRKLKIDLLITIELKNGANKYIVIETKVDSIPSEEQLKTIYNEFSSEHDPNDSIFLLLLFGTSHVCSLPSNLHSFVPLKLDDIIEIFSFNMEVNNKIYDDWMQALKEEVERREKIEGYFKNLVNVNLNDPAAFWKSKGYRIWFPLFYYAYNKLREKSEQPDKWSIYSGGNNAVMQWTVRVSKNDLKDTQILQLLGNFKKDIYFYFEFNDEEFWLKLDLNDQNMIASKSTIAAIKNIVGSIWNAHNIRKGNKAGPYREGNYVSLYRVEFDFAREDFSNIIKEAENIIKLVSSSL